MTASTRRTEDAVIVRVERHSTSYYGNPTYLLHLEDGRTLRTETDGQVGYCATNYAPRSDSPGTPVTLTLTGDKRVRVVGIDAR